jgi:uncharacterized protein YdeI (YjbR/CyaY-like superfamily)
MRAQRSPGSGSMKNESRSLKGPRTLTRDEWRSWLEKNHSKANEAWLIFYKKHAGEGKMSYLEALDDALCYGWIDGRLKRIDDDKHMIRFSPRGKASVWSDPNILRVRKLIAERKMTAAGLTKMDSKTLSRATLRNFKRTPRFRISSEMKRQLMIDEKAWRNYCNLASSAKEQYAYWLSSAKKTETKEKRLKKAIALLKKCKKLGMP